MMNLIKKAIGLVSGAFPEAIALLFARVALAGIFWRSARTKVEDGSFLTMKELTVDLFRDEYGMPFPEITGLIATYAEHFFPILLVLGLATRFGAAGLLVMTLVIQFFVYPEAWWSVHIVWVALAAILITRGGGLFSVDRLFGNKFG
ncbi:DoxX family protein [Parasphingorhabdus cellanae]|uniref:DoxX family protein n=1 Tax=Parasphingorhabdus cellanae TaxID=2806553 RepID=A0ABX7T035_9SPHN|nr:DoxX family protein [Parasphingorhabdus cellanae]QTD54908.1 DoxX family protein [Parasphingorhabdus cellanae]